MAGKMCMMMMVMMVLVIMNCGLKPCNGMDTNVPTPPSLAGEEPETRPQDIAHCYQQCSLKCGSDGDCFVACLKKCRGTSTLF
ncbi:hypothetical protein HID58_004480 [Brassica napus]|uniref:Uncharacterized protein n=2 Tax=Brassica TaxID=3705 RepID=A0A3P6AMV3_BRACM|nr:hypothetical protein HID58_045431 [Brassica napus]KAH0937019.1 hypothetical protein HID58_004480 [Brassica napus]CAF2136289.1 unnamed protein product [Brassica napus]CAG7891763.1 unnamed protein product [Brassica rapa]VDC85508.1 unnamed protein product [Brassica rapa]